MMNDNIQGIAIGDVQGNVEDLIALETEEARGPLMSMMMDAVDNLGEITSDTFAGVKQNVMLTIGGIAGAMGMIVKNTTMDVEPIANDRPMPNMPTIEPVFVDAATAEAEIQARMSGVDPNVLAAAQGAVAGMSSRESIYASMQNPNAVQLTDLAVVQTPGQQQAMGAGFAVG